MWKTPVGVLEGVVSFAGYSATKSEESSSSIILYVRHNQW